MIKSPLAIDLFCGLGGWTDGLIAAGYCVVGFDVERHSTEVEKFVRPDGDGWATASTKPKYYPAQLVLQDVLTLHGSQFRDAAVIVASPPCQNYSYLAMPWSRSKARNQPAGSTEAVPTPGRLPPLR
jgi:site-specific DNA-cytosine methylase